jgi:hypothetical protein
MKKLNVQLKDSTYLVIEQVANIRGKTISDIIDELLSEYLHQEYKTENVEIVFDESQEIWKDIPDYEGLYQVSNYGRVASIRYGFKLRSIVRNPSGYLQCAFRVNNKIQTFLVHVLVAKTFLNKCKDCLQVDHLNNIKTDNRVSNLQWITRSDNIKANYSRGVISKDKLGAKGKKIEVFDLNGNSIAKFDSLKSASEKLGISHGNLSSICNPSARLKTVFSKTKGIRVKAILL